MLYRFLFNLKRSRLGLTVVEVRMIQMLLWGFSGVFQVALPHSLPLPRRETLQQSSSLSTVSPATVDLTLKVHICTAHYRLFSLVFLSTV